MEKVFILKKFCSQLEDFHVPTKKCASIFRILMEGSGG